MTSLEAASAGCPLIAFGANVGHIRVHNAAMARLGLLRLAGTRAELEAALVEHLRASPPRPRLGSNGTAPGTIVSTAKPRVKPLAAWRLAAARVATIATCAGLSILSLTSDEAYSLAAGPLDLRPTSHVATRAPEVGLVIRGDLAPGTVRGLASSMASVSAHASFAAGATVPAALRVALRAAGDDVLPELGGTAPTGWLRTRRLLAGSPHGRQPSRLPGETPAESVSGRTCSRGA